MAWGSTERFRHKMGRRCVGVKGRVPFPRAFYGDPGRGEILEDPTRWCTPTLRPDLSAWSETLPCWDRGPSSLSQRRHKCRRTRRGICLGPCRTRVSRMLGEGDQRMYRALHTLNTTPIAALNNYLHRPRRTRNVLSQRVPSFRKHKVDKVAGGVSRPGNPSAFLGINPQLTLTSE